MVRAFYLAIAPDLFGPTCEYIAKKGYYRRDARVVIEKPLGHDLASSMAINDEVSRIFKEDQVYRIDHYLGKETVQNLLALRFANILFEPIWNAAHIDHVQITVSESVGRRHARLLRRVRRAARHGAEPHHPAALPRRHGAAGLGRRQCAARRKAEGAALC